MINLLGKELSTRRKALLKTTIIIILLQCTLFACIAIFFNLKNLAIMAFLGLILQGTSFALFKKDPRISRIITLLTYLSLVTISSLFTSYAIRLDLYFLPFSVLVSMLFSFNNNRVQVVFFLSLTIIFGIIYSFSSYLPTQFLTIDDAIALQYIYPATIFGAITISILVIHVNYESIEKYDTYILNKTDETIKYLAIKKLFIKNLNSKIREPLNSIIGTIYLLEKNNSREDLLEYIKPLNKLSKSLLELFNSFTANEKGISNTLEPHQTSTNLVNLIKDIIEPYQTVNKNKKVSITFKIDKNFPTFISLDKINYQRVLNNLLSNAVKFTEKGSVKLEILINERNEEKITFKTIITDTGIGITKDQLNLIFKKFTQATSTTKTKYGGSGLGLNLVTEILEYWGTKINYTSTPNLGSKFEFELTTLISQTSIEDIKSKVKEFKNTEDLEIPKNTTTNNILIVDDNETNTFILQSILETEKYKVDISNNGAQALLLLAEKKYNLIIMDLNMPILSGEETIKIIRELNIETPILVFTGNTNITSLENLEVNGFIYKPIEPIEVIKTIKKTISAN